MQCRPGEEPEELHLLCQNKKSNTKRKKYLPSPRKRRQEKIQVAIANMNFRSHRESYRRRRRRSKSQTKNTPSVPMPTYQKSETPCKLIPIPLTQTPVSYRKVNGGVSHNRCIFNHISHTNAISQLLPSLTRLLLLPHIPHPTHTNIMNPPILRIPSLHLALAFPR